MTDRESESLSFAASDLKRTVDSLRSAIDEANDVRDSLSDLSRQSTANRKLINIVGAFAVVNLLIIATVVVMGIQLNNVVRVQHDSALCPLYSLFLRADTPENRQRAIDQGQDPKERARAFDVIESSFRALECREDIRK